jgi:hypothetical protein
MDRCELHSALIDQSQIGFVDQGRGLERVAAPLFAHVMTGYPMEFGFDEELVERIPVPGAPFTTGAR